MRRHLGLSVREAEEIMPWWERRMLLEQMLEDRPWIQYVVQVEMPEDEEVIDSTGDDLAALGVTVREA
jgi:hypothetical protein